MNKGKGPKFGLLIVLAFLIYFSVILFQQQGALKRSRADLAAVQQKVDAENMLAEELNKQKDSLYSDESMEKIAREKLGMVKSGEKVFIDVDR